MSEQKKDPYVSGLHVSLGKLKKQDIRGTMVGVAEGVANDRGLNLMPQRQRVLQKNEIHELQTTDEVDAEPGRTVNKVGIIGFVEITQGGVIGVGDTVFINDREIGKVIGFDETHFPNHYNFVLFSVERNTGIGLGLHVGDNVRIASLGEKTC